MSADGVARVAALAYLCGAHDWLPRLAAALCMQRWPFNLASPWVRAQRQGRIQRRDLGDMKHVGPKGYLGDALQAGAPNWRITLDAVVAALRR